MNFPKYISINIKNDLLSHIVNGGQCRTSGIRLKYNIVRKERFDLNVACELYS